MSYSNLSLSCVIFLPLLQSLVHYKSRFWSISLYESCFYSIFHYWVRTFPSRCILTCSVLTSFLPLLGIVRCCVVFLPYPCMSFGIILTFSKYLWCCWCFYSCQKIDRFVTLICDAIEVSSSYASFYKFLRLVCNMC